MQPAPPPHVVKVRYQVPRDILLRTWFRRSIFSHRRLLNMAVLFGLSVTCFVMGLPFAYAGVLFATLLLMTPIALCLALARALAADRIHTDPKTVEFSPTQIVVTGPDWRSEMTWTR